MQKLAKRLSAVMVAVFTIFSALTAVPVTTVAASAAVKPTATIALQPNATYTQGDILQMKLQAPNYRGRVEYKVVIENLTTKEVTNLFGSANLGYYTKTQPSGLYAFPIHWGFNSAGKYRVFVYVRPANTKIAMSTYAVSNNFTVAPKVDLAANAETAVAAYEKAPLTTADEIAATDALKAAAVEAVAKVEDATAKAAFQARIDAQDKKVADAKLVHVTSVAGVSVNTFKVVFNKDVAAKAENFKIYPSDNQYATMLVKSVSVSGNTAVVTVYDTLSEDTAYTVEVSNVTSADTKFAMNATETKEFTYAVADPASIAFASTKVASGKTVGFVIKDANGNNITANYTVADLTIQSSDDSVVDSTDLTADSGDALTIGGASKYAVVNLSIPDTDISTGNTIIEVYKGNDNKLTQLGRYSLGDVKYDDPTTSLFVGDSKAINVELLDQDGDAYDTDGYDVTTDYVSSNPVVALVDASTGNVQALTAGTTNITVSVTVKTTDGTVVGRVAKAFPVTVKAVAKAATLSVDRTSVTVVKDSKTAGVLEKVHVKVLDQYGNVFKTAANTATVNITGHAVVWADPSDVTPLADGDTIALASGEGDFWISGYTDAVTATVKLTYTGLTSVSVTAKTVAAATPVSSYVVTADSNTLDFYTTADYSKADATTLIHVYQKDSNGNKIAAPDFTVARLVTDTSKQAVDIDNAGSANGGTVAINLNSDSEPNYIGSESIKVLVGSVTAGVLTFNVVDSTPVLSSVAQANTTLGLKNTDTLATKLFGVFAAGEYTTKGAFVGYDQYNNEFEITSSDYTVTSSNSAIVSVDPVTGVPSIEAGATGTVKLIVKVAGKYYTVDLNITN